MPLGNATPGIELLAQADDAHTAVVAQREQCAIAGHDQVCMTGHRAFKDTVVGFIHHDMKAMPWIDDQAQLGQRDSDVRELFGVT